MCIRDRSGEDFWVKAEKLYYCALIGYISVSYTHLDVYKRQVLERMHETTTKIRNVRAYLLVCLFNAPSTINSYYRAEVNHDLYGGGNI